MRDSPYRRFKKLPVGEICFCTHRLEVIKTAIDVASIEATIEPLDSYTKTGKRRFMIKRTK